MTHDFYKYGIDLLVIILWIWTPMYFLDMRHSTMPILWWTFTLVSLGIALYFWHSVGKHSIYG